jgi:hypothetical protein
VVFLGLFLRLGAIRPRVYFHVVGYRDGAPPLVGLVGRPVQGDRLLSCLLPGTGLGISGNALHWLTLVGVAYGIGIHTLRPCMPFVVLYFFWLREVYLVALGE